MPVGLVVAAAGLSIAGGAVGALGAIRSGKAARRLGEMNAQLYERQAEQEFASGIEQARRFRLKAAQLHGQQRLLYSAGGVRTSEGSPLMVIAEGLKEMNLAEMDIRSTAARQSQIAASKARVERFVAREKQVESHFQAAGSLLGGFGGAARIGLAAGGRD